MYCLSSQGSKVVAACMRCDTSGRPLNVVSVCGNALNGLMRPSKRLTALEVSSSVSQQVLVKVSTLKTGCCTPKIRYERSTAPHCLCASLCLEMPGNGLQTPPERSTAPKPTSAHSGLFLDTEIHRDAAEWSTARIASHACSNHF